LGIGPHSSLTSVFQVYLGQLIHFGFLPSLAPEEQLLGGVALVFCKPDDNPTNSVKALSVTQSTEPSQYLSSSFHPPPDSCRERAPCHASHTTEVTTRRKDSTHYLLTSILTSVFQVYLGELIHFGFLPPRAPEEQLLRGVALVFCKPDDNLTNSVKAPSVTQSTDPASTYLLLFIHHQTPVGKGHRSFTCRLCDAGTLIIVGKGRTRNSILVHYSKGALFLRLGLGLIG